MVFECVLWEAGVQVFMISCISIWLRPLAVGVKGIDYLG